MKLRLSRLFLLLWLLPAGVSFPEGPSMVTVSDFAGEGLSGWESKSFKGKTSYRISNGALCAEADNAASGLYREINVDLEKTPVLEWWWKVDPEGIRHRDEKRKEGDDYPARVYVIFSGGLAFWRTRAVNYVWSSVQPKGSHWPNAFTENARMIAAESGAERAGDWIRERRNVREDFSRLFGKEPGDVDAVAIMTDTDNAGGRAAACYRDLRFIPAEQ